MEKINSVRNGLLRLPPGFRFHPTDEELVQQYLKRKVLSYPLPASIITDVEVCKSDPWDLSGDSGHERYYFSTIDLKYPNGNRSNRATTSGYWKATGLDKRIVTSRNPKAQPQLVGMKKTLVFYMGKPPNGTRTDWIMHEYRLSNMEETISGNVPVSKNLPQEKCVLCRIFLKKRNWNNNNSNNSSNSINGGEEKCEFAGATEKVVLYDFMGKERKGRSSSSNSSGITEISCESDEHREETSCCNTTFLIPYKRIYWL